MRLFPSDRSLVTLIIHLKVLHYESQFFGVRSWPPAEKHWFKNHTLVSSQAAACTRTHIRKMHPGSVQEVQA